MDYLLFLLIVNGLLFPAVCQRCPNRWSERSDGDSCYRLWPTVLKTWDHAQKACEYNQGNLLMLESKKEKEWILHEISSYSADYNWWIGLRRKTNDTSWTWVQGAVRNESNTYMDWDTDKPGNESCAAVAKNNLTDIDCKQPSPFICERPKDVPMHCDVDNGWDNLIPSSCYKFFKSEQPFQEASEICNRSSARLLKHLGSSVSHGALLDYLQGENNASSWLNLKYKSTDNGWIWQDNGKKLRETKWWYGKAPNSTSIEHNETACAILSSTYRKWTIDTCVSRQSFMCEKKKGVCPDGFIQHQSTCFLFNIGINITWNEARGFCNLRGTKLLEIKKKSDQSFVLSHALSKGTEGMWLAFQGNGTNMTWDAGETMGTFEDSQFVRPLNQHSGCGYVLQGDGKWHIGSCSARRLAVCTVPVDTLIRTPQKTKPKMECPFTFKSVGNKCYKTQYGDPRDWYSGQQQCKRQGTYLASPHNTEEQQFLLGTIKDETWLGYSDRRDEGTFSWVNTHVPFLSNFWKPGEPNNVAIGQTYSENCVAMHYSPGKDDHGKWKDLPCSFKRNVICETRGELNIAYGKIVSQSSGQGYKAVDGCKTRTASSRCCSRSSYELNPWWELDLGTYYHIGKIVIHRRSEHTCSRCKRQFHNFRIFVTNISKAENNSNESVPIFQDKRPEPPVQIILKLPENTYGRYVRIDIPDRAVRLELCEVQVFRGDEIRSTVLNQTNSNCYIDSSKWIGNISYTMTGRTCQAWIMDTPHKHTRHTGVNANYPDGDQHKAKNYCRDPDGEGQPWCYTTDRKKRWEFCDIPQCHSVIQTNETTPKKESECGAGWTESDSDGVCYIYGSEQLTWMDAENVCEYYGGSLVTPDTDAQQQRVILRYPIENPHGQLQNFSLWFGVFANMTTLNWQSLHGYKSVNQMMKTKLEGTKIASTPRCIRLDVNNQTKTGKWKVANCLDRNLYICSKLGPYFMYHSTNESAEKYTEITGENKRLSIKNKTSIQFEIKGTLGGIMILQNTLNDTLEKIYEITLCSRHNTKAFIKTKDKTPKMTSRVPNLCSDNEYRPFWISWKDDTIKVGRGTSAGRNILMQWYDSNFTGVNFASIVTGKGHEGYWKFKRETTGSGAGQITTTDVTNVALGKPTYQTSNYTSFTTSNKAVDGCEKTYFGSKCCTHTNKDNEAWWQVDLLTAYPIKEVLITKRTDCCGPRLKGFRLFISNFSDSTNADDIAFRNGYNTIPATVTRVKTKGVIGRYVKIDIPNRAEHLELCEVKVISDEDVSRCGVNWKDFNGRACYKFINVKMSWHDALDYCKDIDSELAVLKSPEEQMFVYEQAFDMVEPTPAGNGLWLGMHDKTKEGKFETVDGSDLKYTDWGEGEPNDFLGSEDCVALRLDQLNGTGKWNDSPCVRLMPFVCQKKELSKTTTTVSTSISSSATTAINTTPSLSKKECGDGWHYNAVNKACYLIVFKTGITFHEAAVKCSLQNSRLSNIESKDEQLFLKGIFKSENITGKGFDSLWVAGSDEETGVWKWYLYGSKVSNDLLRGRPQPGFKSGTKHCMEISMNEKYIAKLNDVPCDFPDIRGYICKRSAGDYVCDKGWYSNPRSVNCLKDVYIAKKWHDARDYCRNNLGANLVSIGSKEEKQFLTGIARRRKDTGLLWTGANDIVSEGQWKWSDGTSWWSKLQWGWGIPKLFEPTFDCGVIHTTGSMRFDRRPCNVRYPFLCEKKAVKKGTPSFTPATQGIETTTQGMNIATGSTERFKSRCGVNWDDGPKSDFCYQINKEFVTWKDAEARCKQEGGHLLSIVDLEEQNYILGRLYGRQLPSPMLWIGVNDIDVEGAWKWSDGSPYAYFNWKSDANTHLYGNTTGWEDCGAIMLNMVGPSDLGRWISTNCSIVNGYICKRKMAGVKQQDKKAGVTINGTTVSIYQPRNTDFKTHDVFDLRIRPIDNVHFSVKTTHDARLLLRQNQSDYTNNVVHVTFGETKSTITWRNKTLAENVMKNMVTATEYRAFWISWNNTSVRVGNSSTIGNDTILIWNELPIEINFISVGTDQNSDTYWEFYNEMSTYGCPGHGWQGFRESCYLFVQEKNSWNTANKYCRHQGGELASISDKFEQDFIMSRLPYDSYCFNIWRNTSACRTWAKKGECERNPTWMATHCHQACNLCMTNCRDRYYSTEQCMEWTNIKECDKNSSWMHENCAGSCGICQGAPTRGLWIGLRSNEYGQQYTWSDHSKMTFTAWNAHQPTSYALKTGSCGAVYIQSGRWNDGSCDGPLSGFICERPKMSFSSKTKPSFKSGCTAENSYGYRDYCYTYVKLKKSWSEAKKYCKVIDGSLVSIHDRYVQAFVASEMVDASDDYWIGLTRSNKTLSWDDTSNVTFTQFNEGFQASLSGESCFVMTTTRPVGTWIRKSCNTRLPFVCQTSRPGFTTQQTTPPTTVATPSCKSPWIYFNGFCFKVSLRNESLTWYKARLICSQYGAFLINIRSPEESTFIQQHMGGTQAWLGALHRTWFDETEILYNANVTEESGPRTKVNTCVVFGPGNVMKTISCFVPNRYICKIPQGKEIRNKTTSANTEELVNKWHSFGGKFSYFVGTGDGMRKKWYDASAYCRGLGGELASIHSDLENSRILSMINKVQDDIWIGLRYSIYNTLRWLDDSELQFTSWSPSGQPRMEAGRAEILAISRRDGFWKPYYMSDLKSFVCKRVVNSSSTPVIENGCQNGFKQFGNKCYYVGGISDNLKNWTEARKSCRQLNSQLISIHSVVEQAFVTSLLINETIDFWTGLRDFNRDIVFHWSDYTAVVFTNWEKNTPGTGTSHNMPHCVYIKSVSNLRNEAGGWDQSPYTLPKGYICANYNRPTSSVQSTSGIAQDCKEGYIRFWKSCYKLVKTKQSWNASIEICQNDGADIATLDNEYEHNFIFAMVEYTRTWIGAPVTSYVPPWYRLYGNQSQQRTCNYISGPDWKHLFSESCSQSYQTICKMHAGTNISIPQTTTVSSRVVTCPSMWVGYAGHCYYFRPFERLTFYEALDRCRGFGSDLVSIHSKNENNKMASIVTEIATSQGKQPPSFGLWTGLLKHPATPEDISIAAWTDKSPMDFNNFDTDNRRSSIRDICVSILPLNTVWYGNMCNLKKGYICKGSPDMTSVAPMLTTVSSVASKQISSSTQVSSTKRSSSPTSQISVSTAALSTSTSSSTATSITSTSTTIKSTRKTSASTQRFSMLSSSPSSSVSTLSSSPSSSVSTLSSSPSTSVTSQSTASYVNVPTTEHYKNNASAQMLKAQHDTDGLNTGEIVGIVIGVAGVLCIVAAAMFLLLRFTRRQRDRLIEVDKAPIEFNNAMFNMDTIMAPDN